MDESIWDCFYMKFTSNVIHVKNRPRKKLSKFQHNLKGVLPWRRINITEKRLFKFVKAILVSLALRQS